MRSEHEKGAFSPFIYQEMCREESEQEKQIAALTSHLSPNFRQQ